MIHFQNLRIGDRVIMLYPNGILQEAVLVGNDEGKLTFQVGAFVRDFVGSVLDIFLDTGGEWSIGAQ